MTPEFSRPERIDTIGEGAREIAVEANEAERAALAHRFGLLGIDRLAARFAVARQGEAIVAEGRVEAAVTQACSATGVPLPATVDEPVTLRFVEGSTALEEEIELADDALDTIEIEGGTIDLGEAAAETMALALDPFPRAPGAEAALRAAGVIAEEEAGAFGALADLKRRLENG